MPRSVLFIFFRIQFFYFCTQISIKTHEMDTLSMVMTDNGFVSFNGKNPIYHYFLKDHLGSVRVVMSESGQRRQVNHYYPFGGLTGESSGGGVQRRKYVGIRGACDEQR